MSPDEALKLCRLAKAASPAQAVDEYTPELWALVLADVRFIDAQQALVDLAAEQEWIHVSHIVKRVKRIRAKRVSDHPPVPVPPEVDAAVYEGRTEVYAKWISDTNRRLGDGEVFETPVLPAMSEARKRELGEFARGAFQEVPDE
jgi:hypothetical protein